MLTIVPISHLLHNILWYHIGMGQFTYVKLNDYRVEREYTYYFVGDYIFFKDGMPILALDSITNREADNTLQVMKDSQNGTHS